MTTLTESLSIPEAAAKIGAKPSTVRRWITTGVAVAGRRVKLAARRTGGLIRITPAAIEQFDRECNPDAPAPVESPKAAAARRKRERDALLADLKGGAL